MDIRLISIIKDRHQKLIGCRLYEVGSGSIKDVSVSSMLNVLNSGDFRIRGVEVRDGGLVGTNGGLNRFPVIVDGGLYGKSPFIILFQLMRGSNVIGYRVIDWKGQVLNFEVNEAIQYARENGVANGAVKVINEKTIISSIVGEYEKIDIDKQYNSQRDVDEDIENTVWSYLDFVAYMNKNGYKFFSGSTVQSHNSIYSDVYLDSDVKVFKYPNGAEIIYNIGVRGKQYTIETLIIPPSVNSIYWGIFNEIVNLKRIVIQEGVRTLSFRGRPISSSVEELKLPSSLETLDEAFSDMENIGVLDLECTQLTGCYSSFNGLGIKELILPDGLINIRESFNELKEVENIRFPSDINKLGGNNFTGLESLERLDLSNCTKLKSIGKNTFRSCGKLREVKLPDSIEELENGVFGECTRLERINIPKNLRQIGAEAIGTPNIRKFVVRKQLERLGRECFSINTIIELEEGTVETRINILEGCSRVKLPESLTKISENTFKGSLRLQGISIPKKVRVIEDSAFECCGSMNSVSIEKGSKLEYIGDSAFEFCDEMQSINLDECKELKRIGDRAFRESGIAKIIIPDGTEYIGDRCFEDCRKLIDIVLPASLRFIGEFAFNFRNRPIAGRAIHVYEGSVGLDYCKKNRLIYNVINSLDEVCSIRDKNRLTSNNDIAKAKMVLNRDRIHGELLKSEYINYFKELLLMYEHMGEDLEYGEIKLDSRKFWTYNESSMGVLDGIIKRGKGFEVGETNTMSIWFINLCNLLTSTFDLRINSLIELRDKYLKEGCSTTYNVCYWDGYNSIVKIDIYNCNDEYFKRSIIVIVIGGEIRFTTTINPIVKKGRYYTDEFDNWMSHDQLYYDECNKSVADFLVAGDAISFIHYISGSFNSIRGIGIPEYIYLRTVENIKNNFIIVGRGKPIVRLGGDESRKDYYIILDLMCKVTAKIVTVKVYYSSPTYSLYHITTIENIDKMLVLDVRNFNKMSDSTRSRIKRGIQL